MIAYIINSHVFSFYDTDIPCIHLPIPATTSLVWVLPTVCLIPASHISGSMIFSPVLRVASPKHPWLGHMALEKALWVPVADWINPKSVFRTLQEPYQSVFTVFFLITPFTSRRRTMFLEHAWGLILLFLLFALSLPTHTCDRLYSWVGTNATL
jgi:hypothetical protein